MCNVERWAELRWLARRIKMCVHVGQVLKYAGRSCSRTLFVNDRSTPLFLAFLSDTGRGIKYRRKFRMGKLGLDKSEMDGLRLALHAPTEPFWRTAARRDWCWFEVWGEVVAGDEIESFNRLFDIPMQPSARPPGVVVEARIPGPYADRRDCGAEALLPIEMVEEFRLWLSELMKRKAKGEHGNIKAIRRKIEIGRRIGLLQAALVHRPVG